MCPSCVMTSIKNFFKMSLKKNRDCQIIISAKNLKARAHSFSADHRRCTNTIKTLA